MFLISKGDQIFEQAVLDELMEYLSNMEMLEDNDNWLLFKMRWEEVVKAKSEIGEVK